MGLILHYCVWKPREARRRNEWSLEGVSNDQKTVVGDDEEDGNGGSLGGSPNSSRRHLELPPAARSPPVPSLILPLPTISTQVPRPSLTEPPRVTNSYNTDDADRATAETSNIDHDAENPCRSVLSSQSSTSSIHGAASSTIICEEGVNGTAVEVGALEQSKDDDGDDMTDAFQEE